MELRYIVQQARRVREQLEGVRRIATRAYVRMVVEALTGIGLHRVGSSLVADWLQRMFEATARNPDCTMLASRQLQHEHRNLLDSAGDVVHVSGAYWRRGHGRLDKGQFITEDEESSPCAAAALYRRNVFLAVGGFDKAFFCYGEGVGLAFRLRLTGERCMYVPHAVAWHVGSASSGRSSDFTVYHGHRNLVWLYVKNMPGPLLLLYLPQHLFWNLVTILWFMLRGQGVAILRAKWDALRSLSRALRKRRQVQSQRRHSPNERSDPANCCVSWTEGFFGHSFVPCQIDMPVICE
jgi:GT2 family glycosyltransferase